MLSFVCLKQTICPICLFSALVFAYLLLLYIRIYLIVYIYVNMCILQDNKESDL